MRKARRNTAGTVLASFAINAGRTTDIVVILKRKKPIVGHEKQGIGRIVIKYFLRVELQT